MDNACDHDSKKQRWTLLTKFLYYLAEELGPLSWRDEQMNVAATRAESVNAISWQVGDLATHLSKSQSHMGKLQGHEQVVCPVCPQPQHELQAFGDCSVWQSLYAPPKPNGLEIVSRGHDKTVSRVSWLPGRSKY